jgi:hypothetical protein
MGGNLGRARIAPEAKTFQLEYSRNSLESRGSDYAPA